MNAIRWVESAMTASRHLFSCSAPSLGGLGESARTFVSGALGAAFLAAVLAFPAGEAQAQTPTDPRNQCGALSSGAATCSNQAYASGIRYDVAPGGWVNGIAGDVALTVTGGTATTITTPTTTGWASGIVVRTAEQGSSDSTTRTITLTVGENAAVAIAQSTNTITDGFDNTGVVIHQRGAAADATTVTLGNGVTIGTATTAMKRSGVHVLVENGANTATHKIDSAATIYSAEFGLIMDNRGAGNVEVMNRGSITTTTTGGSNAGNKSGIRILDWSHSPPGSLGGDSRTADTTTTVTNSGSVTVSAAQARGIEVNAEGLGLYRIVNSGTVSASGADSGHGVFVNATYKTGAAGSEAIEIENSGAIATTGEGGHGIYVETFDASAPGGDGNIAITNRGSIASRNHGILVNADMGAISVTHSGGTVSSSNADAIRLQQSGAAVTVRSSGDVTAENHGVFVSNVAGAGTVSITHSAGTITAKTGSGIRVAIGGTGGTRITTTGGRITAGADGLHAGIAASNPSGVTIANGAAVNAGGYGIVVWYGGEGETRIENSGAITAGNVGIHADDGGAGAITIENSADVTGDNHGIFARNTQGRGAVTVTHSAGEIHGKAESGIAAWIGRWQREDDADSPDPISTATVRVEVTGGSVKASETRGRVAIAALNHEGGSAEVSVSKGATLSAKHNAGIYAQLADRQNTAGQIKVTQGGAITARKGVYASVSRASAVTIAAGVTTREMRDAMKQPLIDVTWTGTFTETERTLTTTLNNVAHAIESAQEAQAGEDEVIRGAAHTAGIDAEVLSWRVLNRIATRGDDPGAFADAAAQTALFADSADAATKARAAAIVTRFREVLAAGTLVTIPGAGDVDGDNDGSYSDAEIRTYLMEDSDARRTLLRDVLARGLSAAEKAVLQALVTDGGDLDAALDGVTGATDAWKDEVRALLNNYNTGNIRVAMNGGSINSSGGDGIRAWYARQHDRNGAISVTVAEGASVTGGAAGVYVANAGAGLRIAKKYLTPATQDENENLKPDDLVTLADYLNQVVRVDGTVTGGKDAAVHLVGGGALIVGRTGRLVAGSSGRTILVNDPGPAVIYIEGQVSGGAGREAAVDLTGGGELTVGATGRVEANGASSAIRSDGSGATVVIAGEVKGSEGGAAAVHVAGGGTVTIRAPTEPGAAPRVDANGASSAIRTDGSRTDLVIEGEVKGSEGGEAAVHLAGGGTVTVAEGASVTGGAAGVYVANAGAGLRIAKKYLTPAIQAENENLKPDDLVTLADYLNQVVRVDGTVTGGRDAAVHLDGGGALIVGRTGRLVAGSSGRTILVNDPAPAIIWIEGQVRGGAGGRTAVDLTGGGGLTVGATGRVEANGATSAIRSDDPETTVVIAGQVKGSEGGEAAVHLAGGGTVTIRAPTEPGAAPRVDANGATRAIRGGGAGRMATVRIETTGSFRYRQDAAEIASGAVVGSYAGVSTVTLVEVDESGETGVTLPLTTDGNVDGENIDLPPRPRPPQPDARSFNCEGQRRCELYEALPSALLTMNGMLSYAERTRAARDANGGWARVEGARGKWEAKKAKTTGKLSYDHRRGGVRAGVDFGAGEQGRVGVSVHLLNGKAERSGVGDVEVDGMGAGASATWRTGDLYVDVQAGATWYEVNVGSADPKRDPLVKEADGLGYAMEVEAGQRMAMGEGLVVTPRVGLAWSKVGMDDFTEMVASRSVRVSVEDAHSARGRLGVLVEMEAGLGERSGRLFGSLDVEQEFSDETRVDVGVGKPLEIALKTEVRPTTLRLGVGGMLGLDEDMVLRGAAGYETSGSGTSGYGGGLELNLRF